MSDIIKPKVLIIFGDAAETVDTMYPYFRLIEDGFEPILAAPEKREYQMVMHQNKPGWTITKEWEGYSMHAAIAFKDVTPEDYIGIFFSGGRAPEYIREDKDLIKKMNNSISNYKKFIKSRLITDGNQDPNQKIIKIIKKEFF